MRALHGLPSGSTTKQKTSAKSRARRGALKAPPKVKSTSRGASNKTLASAGNGGGGNDEHAKTKGNGKAKVHGHGNGNGHAATAGATPDFDQKNADYDKAGEEYGEAVPVPFNPGTSVAVMDLSGKPVGYLAERMYAVGEALTVNPYGLDVTDILAECSLRGNELTTAMTAQKNAQDLAKSATQVKDEEQANSESFMKSYTAWVQAESKGNPAVINAYGLMVKKAGTRPGELSPPDSVLITAGPSLGMLDVNWPVCSGAKSYNVRYALVKADGGEPVWVFAGGCTKRTMRLSGLVTGANYMVEVAAVGGSTGQSIWSLPSYRVCS